MGWLVVTIASLLLAWWSDRRRRVYADLEAVPAAAVYAGRNEVNGRAWHKTPTLAHQSRIPCVVWRYSLDEERKQTHTDAKGNKTTTKVWKTIDTKSGGRPHFDLIDDSGSVRIRLEKASVTHRQLLREEFEVPDPRSFFEKMFSFGDDRTGNYRHVETGIAIGDDVFVSGEASLRNDVVEPQIDHGSPFVVSTRSEDSHRNWLGFVTIVLLAVALFTAGVAGRAADDAWVAPLFVGVTLAAIVSGLLISLYNRLQGQVQSAARAWSLIDVQLARRHDLIPRLAAVAEGLADYERSVFEGIAEARTSLSGQAPTDDTVARADREAADQTTRIRQVLVVVEDHPELKADQAMLELQRQLADAENRIAHTREFYNDTVTLLRSQRQSFPGLLVARFADRRRFALFGAEGFERTVPEVEFDWDVGRET